VGTGIHSLQLSIHVITLESKNWVQPISATKGKSIPNPVFSYKYVQAVRAGTLGRDPPLKKASADQLVQMQDSKPTNVVDINYKL
jgi:hypothetical protein